MVKNKMTSEKGINRIVIMGAAGRDFHNFNTVYRNDPSAQVVAFTATQIPQISDRSYPPTLSGSLYPEGIPIIPEEYLQQFCLENDIHQVIFSYSDITHQQVMHKASLVLSTGADFILLGPQKTMIKSKVPVIAVSAVRTGCGKSQTCRWLAKYLKQKGFTVAAIRHPMPYGDISKQAVQRFESPEDLDRANCTIEEREEYEPHLAAGVLVYAGADYQSIVKQAQQEVDIIIWDGGNNDFPFITPDLHLVLVDPLRPGHEFSYHPGEATLRMADVVIIPKVNVAKEEDIQNVSESIRAINPQAKIIKAESRVSLENVAAVRNKRALVIEDGPTTTHGGMAYGAGYIAALQAPVKEIVDPRPGAVKEIKAVFEKYTHLENILPAVGYFPEQLQALEDTINAIDADVVIAATPCDLNHLLSVNKPIVRVGYEYEDTDSPNLQNVVEQFLQEQN